MDKSAIYDSSESEMLIILIASLIFSGRGISPKEAIDDAEEIFAEVKQRSAKANE